jgi:drug/metabolite transporter (DMT)-like permease
MNRLRPDDRDRLDRGVLLALAAAVLFGVSAPFAKLLLRGAAPQLLAGLLYLGSGAGLARTPASSASLLLNLEGVLTALSPGSCSARTSIGASRLA